MLGKRAHTPEVCICYLDNRSHTIMLFFLLTRWIHIQIGQVLYMVIFCDGVYARDVQFVVQDLRIPSASTQLQKNSISVALCTFRQTKLWNSAAGQFFDRLLSMYHLPSPKLICMFGWCWNKLILLLYLPNQWIGKKCKHFWSMLTMHWSCTATTSTLQRASAFSASTCIDEGW